ncbi:outer membrane lipoprotein chaperone LolA [Pseudoalteromonas sp. SSDWG2]|uniref:outer membrane lipoprotein chaperone LolA n=1 Tax=Pseudoalteromonas sp. SSDWG2 TaxID=3139391 RepID=UPI003BAB9AF7
MKKMITPALAATSILASSFTLADEAQQLKKQLSHLSSLNSAFTQQVYDPQGELVSESEGRLELEQPKKIRWQQNQPDETLFVSNGVNSFYFDPFAEQVTLLDTETLIDSTPFILLTTNDDALWQQFSITNENAAYVVTPINRDNAQVEQLTLYFGDDLQVSKVEVLDRSGQRSVFTFVDAAINEDIDDARFDFVIPEHVFVDDQRKSAGTDVSGE